MSTVRRTSALYNAHFGKIAALQPEHASQFQALAEGLTSAALADLHSEFELDFSVDTVEDVKLMWGIVERNIPFEQAFSEATFSQFSHVESLVESLEGLDEDEVEPELIDFHNDLLYAINEAREEMAGVEQRGAAAAIDLALKDLGYHVERADIDGVVTGFEASKANSKLAVEVTAGGEVVTDFVGLSDTETCGTAQEELVEKVATYGVDLAEHARHDHRDTRGGGLVQRVARASGRTLADRIVSAHGSATATQSLGRQARATRLMRES